MTDGHMTDGRSLILSPESSASPEEAAAIVAALGQFMRATASPAPPPGIPIDDWRRAALLEGVSRDPGDDVPDPWINT
jgi:hypothetical protein